MPDTKRLFLCTNKYYWHILKYTIPEAPKKESCWTTEFSSPFRNGIGKARKIPFTNTALVIGKWVGKDAQAKKIVENELTSCENHMDQVEKELRRIIGVDTHVEKYG